MQMVAVCPGHLLIVAVSLAALFASSRGACLLPT